MRIMYHLSGFFLYRKLIWKCVIILETIPFDDFLTWFRSFFNSVFLSFSYLNGINILCRVHFCFKIVLYMCGCCVKRAISGRRGCTSLRYSSRNWTAKCFNRATQENGFEEIQTEVQAEGLSDVSVWSSSLHWRGPLQHWDLSKWSRSSFTLNERSDEIHDKEFRPKILWTTSTIWKFIFI